MAEPRRSGRSTKGQNSRFSDIGPENDTPIPVAPKSKKSKSSPAPPASSTRPPAEPADGKAEGQAEDAGKEENAPDDIIRCVCGAKEEDENRDRMMIQCDGCDAWQHTLCMSIPRRKIPKEYFCEVCKPENHQVLLEKMARGEKPWEKKPKGAASKVKKDVKENTPIRTSSRSARKASTPVLDLKESDTPLIHKVTKELPAEPAPPAMEKKPVKPQSQKKTTEKPTKTKTTEQAKKKENEKEVKEEAMEMESEKPIEKPVEKAGDMPFDKVEQEKETETEKGDKGGEQQKELELANETLGQHVVLGSTNIAQKMPGSSQIVTSTEPQLNVMPETEKVIATNGASPNASAPAAVAEVTKVSPGDDHHTPAKPKARKNTSKDKPPSRVIKEKLARPVKRKAQAEPPAEHKNNDEQKAHDTPRRISVGTREQKPVERRQSIAVPVRKMSIPDDNSFQPELVRSIGELRNRSRHPIVKYIAGSFTEHLKMFIDTDKFELPEDVSIEEYAERLGIEIEHHIYLRFYKPGALTKEYQSQTRSVGFNIKENEVLCEELVHQRLSPEKLASMNSEQLAKKELQEFRMQVRIQSEKHHTLIHETGPRIRRTHKGEELVGEAEVPSNDTILTSTNIPRREPVEETLKSPSAVIDESTTPVTAHPEYTTPVHAEEDSSRPQTANRPPPIDTSTAEASRKRKFDLEKVWSHVESSDTKKIARQLPSRTPTSAMSHYDVMEKIDKDIDMLLRDGEDQEMEDAEPPYSPKSFNDHYSPPPDDGGVWRGIIELEKICVLEATATLIGGPEYIQGVRWTDMVATHIAINGRIPMERASEYLEGHYYSSTCAVVCASIKPRTSANEDAFRQIFEYFHTRKRYAVVGQNRHVRLKDLYIIPLEADERVPQWWPALKPAATISDDQRDERLLLMTCVIHLVPKSQEPDGNGEGMNGAGETRTDGQASIGSGAVVQATQEYSPAAPLHSQQNQHAYYTYGNQYQPAAPPVNNTSQQLAYYSNNGNNASLAQPQQHYDQYYQSQQPYHPQQPQMQPQHQSQAQPQPQIQSPPYQPQDSHPQQQQVGAYFHHPLLGNFYQQHLYAQPPASSASTPQPPHHQSPQQPAGSSFLTMTQDLQTLVPGISHDDLVTINKLLEENPHLQTDATTLVKAVDKILGK